MRLYTTVAALRSYIKQHRTAAALTKGIQPTSLALVPTMGALHIGHRSLIERARQKNSSVIVSIFVNPLQFGPNEDFQKYPRTLEHDRQLCEEAGVDVVFAPTPQELGLTSHNLNETQVTPTEVVPPAAMTSVLCGCSRPGHFQGVTTIVTKLFNLVQPDRAYFGQKDAQQVAIIQRMVHDLNIPVEIVSCPIIREPSGLAYSSRNQYLSAEEKDIAPALYRSLLAAEQTFKAGDHTASAMIASVKNELMPISQIQLEYIDLVDPTTLMPLEKIEEVGLLALAARLGSTRLIDNIVLQNRQPIVAIDGPAGAGKSTVASMVAKSLGLLYLDTGAMYRAVTWLVLQSKIPLDDEPTIAELVSRSCISFDKSVEPGTDDCVLPSQIFINGENVTEVIRTLEVTAHVSAVSALPAVREVLVKQQQSIGQKGGLVAEGRDIGTHVFPDAELKIFLTASAKERARRRLPDLQKHNQETITIEKLEADIEERDRKDSTRAVSPLRKATDAIEIVTDGLTIPEVVNRIVNCYHSRT
ncbi:MAG TPA: bifunctional pantoate--beta-alanine ligase/(d)CMP kinase [Halomicronema sp.]